MTDTKPAPEIVAGKGIEISFDASLCIHSRFCVLQAPDVFQANTPGDWIFPDRMDDAALAAVARNCPSGAITYTPDNPALAETDPPVNTVRLREDGPHAFSASLAIAGDDEAQPVRRRTLCRCGASQNKPFCDGSHARIGFKATGEPPTQTCKALSPRSGRLTVTPMKDGPLEIAGPAELVSGTGRTFAKTTHALLCRCGGSGSKPFCDGSHASNGFTDRQGYKAPEQNAPAPSLADWAGGREKLKALTTDFYAKIPADPLLAPLFAGMYPRHAERVADFIAEVFGGANAYSGEGGSHVGMILKHLGRGVT